MTITDPKIDLTSGNLLPVSSLGFTGSREGLTIAQMSVVCYVLDNLRPLASVHHGDCVGADATFHDICRETEGIGIIVGHPPTNPKNRAYKECDVLREPKDYHVRDKDIVYETQLLLGCPKGPEQMRGSGTWTTIRFARSRGTGILIVMPDGTIVREN